MSFQEDYDKLSTGEKSQFSETMNNLLYHCFIVRKRYDVTTGLEKIQYDYTFIEKHYSLLLQCFLIQKMMTAASFS